ncbi:MAG: hypothetical protein HON70_46825, partial [Lentisphaerae bacterium]|nr:hypothetical protein [Lentisphaerota bacterium]
NIEGAASRDSAFGVEVLDAASGEVLGGFSRADCRMPAGDGLAVPIAWQGGDALPVGRDIRLRFHLGAPSLRLYSFGFRSVK